MPAEGIHLTSFREGMAVARLPASARRAIARAEHAARLGALFPDLPYFASFNEELIRYVTRRRPRANPWGDRTHASAVAILHGVVRRAARVEGDVARGEAQAFALGLASHLAIDRALHPLVNWLADADVARTGTSHASAHREVEKFQSICFHESYFGKDMMGTAMAGAHLFIAGLDHLESSVAGAIGRLAIEDALGDAPSMDELSRWGRSFMRYARILASPLGKTVASGAEKEAARPRYLEGAWGAFDQRLARAVDASGAVLEVVWALLDGPPRDLAVSEIRRSFAGLLDEGTIDPPGSTFSP